MLLLSTARAAGQRRSAPRHCGAGAVVPDVAGVLYGLVVHALWFAPLYAWLLLVSAWARRAPLLWAVLPSLALGVVERMAFGTSHFGSLIRYRLWARSAGLRLQARVRQRIGCRNSTRRDS